LHVLSTPPAFILSQDQTLRCRSNPLGQLALPSVEFASCCPCRLASTATSGPPSLARWVQRVHLSLSGSPSLRRPSLPLRAAHRATTRDFPESQIRFATGLTIKGPSIATGIAPRERRHSEPRRVVRTHLSSLIALTRRLFLLTGPHTSTALRPLLPLSEDPAPPQLIHSFCSNRRSGSVSS
jgi:hypothetical protein